MDQQTPDTTVERVPSALATLGDEAAQAFVDEHALACYPDAHEELENQMSELSIYLDAPR